MKRKQFMYVIVIALLVLLNSNVIVYPMSINKNKDSNLVYLSNAKEILKPYFDKESMIRKNVFKLGEDIFGAVNKNMKPPYDENYLENIVSETILIQKELLSYSQTELSDEETNNLIQIAIRILSNYRNAVYELQDYATNKNQSEKYKALERYFYNRSLAVNTANWLNTVVNEF